MLGTCHVSGLLVQSRVLPRVPVCVRKLRRHPIGQQRRGGFLCPQTKQEGFGTRSMAHTLSQVSPRTTPEYGHQHASRRSAVEKATRGVETRLPNRASQNEMQNTRRAERTHLQKNPKGGEVTGRFPKVLDVLQGPQSRTSLKSSARGTSFGHTEMFPIISSHPFASNYSDAQDALKQKRYLRRAGSFSNPFLAPTATYRDAPCSLGRHQTAHDSLDTLTVVVHAWERQCHF